MKNLEYALDANLPIGIDQGGINLENNAENKIVILRALNKVCKKRELNNACNVLAKMLVRLELERGITNV